MSFAMNIASLKNSTLFPDVKYDRHQVPAENVVV